MALPLNVERARFRPGEYVGYDGTGFVWNIRRHKEREWVARPGANHPGRFSAALIFGKNLSEVANKLVQRNPNRPAGAHSQGGHAQSAAPAPAPASARPLPADIDDFA